MGYLSPPPAPAPVIVYKDVGGLVTDYEAQTEQYRRENRDVRLHECRSACTLALSLPNVCVYPDAKVKFHQAYNAITKEVDLGVSSKLFASYPAQVQARLGYLTREYHVLSGVELIALGMRNCNGDNPVLVAKRKEKALGALAQNDATPSQQGSALNSASNSNSNAASNSSWGEIARKVQSAVASALTPDGRVSAPIRVAVADRENVSEERSNATARLEDVVSARAALAPLPPRRPIELSLISEIPARENAREEAPRLSPRLTRISGADKILLDKAFSLAGK
ncbi:MAG: hypothetical protein ACKOEW_02535 [Methylocystis sp.]